MQHRHPIAYHSKKFSEIVCKYPTYDKDLNAIIQACKEWKHYILGKETMKFCETLRRCPISDNLYLCRVHMNTFMINDVP